jgi:integrase
VRGHIRKRGRRSFEIKFDRGADAVTGRRTTQYVTVRGTRKDAEAKLHELINAVSKGSYTPPSKVIVSAFANERVGAWPISARTRKRYKQIVEHQIGLIGNKPLQHLSWMDIERWHADMSTKKGLAPGTVRQAHRLLGQVLRDGKKAGYVSEVVTTLQKPQKVGTKRVQIAKDAPAVMEQIMDSRLYPIAVVGLYCGLRLGEILALRDEAVDLGKGVIHVRESLTDAGERKSPKTDAGTREVTMPAIVVEVLRKYRIELMQQRLLIGAGRLQPDDLLFATIDGEPLRLQTVSRDWARLMDRIGRPEITFHSLRHCHASMLIRAGLDLVLIGRRLGHANAAITLSVYGHLVEDDDRRASAAIDAVLAGK